MVILRHRKKMLMKETVGWSNRLGWNLEMLKNLTSRRFVGGNVWPFSRSQERMSVKWGWQAYTAPQRVFKITFL